MWTTYYLKYVDDKAFYASLPQEWKDGEGQPLPAGPDHVLDPIGNLHRDDDTPPASGYHVNVRLRTGLALPLAMSVFGIAEPAMPKRVFA